MGRGQQGRAGQPGLALSRIEHGTQNMTLVGQEVTDDRRYHGDVITSWRAVGPRRPPGLWARLLEATVPTTVTAT